MDNGKKLLFEVWNCDEEEEDWFKVLVITLITIVVVICLCIT